MKESINLKDTVYSGVYSKLLSCIYKPGDVITESSLMKEYNCSKTPVREALLSLCAEGVLRSVPRYGYIVSHISVDEVIDMLRFRVCVEREFLKNNFQKFTDEQIDMLAEIDAQFQNSKNEAWEKWELHWELNIQFHLKLLSFCNNKYAVEMLESCLLRLKRAYAQYYLEMKSSDITLISQKTRLNSHNHTKIISALRRKNCEELLEYLDRDILDFGGIHLKRDEVVLI